MIDNEKIKEALKTISDETKGDNPFVSSDEFINGIKLIAAMSRIVLRKCSNSAEALNATMSVVVTYLKNIPDNLWELMTKANAGNGEATQKMFAHLDGLRSYEGKNYIEVDGTDLEDDIPAMTANPPRHSC